MAVMKTQVHVVKEKRERYIRWSNAMAGLKLCERVILDDMTSAHVEVSWGQRRAYRRISEMLVWFAVM